MDSYTVRQFWRSFRRLPRETRRAAISAYRDWLNDPFLKSLQFKEVNAEHHVWSVRVGLHWRPLGWRVQPDRMVWFWIGSHADYDQIVKQSRTR